MVGAVITPCAATALPVVKCSEGGDSVWEIKNVRCGTIIDIRVSTPDLIAFDLRVSVDATKRRIQSVIRSVNNSRTIVC